jgi:hypothetical protein
MPWYAVQLTPAQVRAEYGRIRAQFETVFRTMRAPADMAMFSHQEPGADPLHLYFLLPDGDVLEAFRRLVGAKPCERPPAHAAFEVGHNDTLERLRRGDPP